MAVGTIVTVLAKIPWSTVVDNAPKVADGAARLWGKVSGWNKADPLQQDPAAAPAPAPATTPQPSQTELLAARLQAVEASVRHLHEQMQASSALIKDLAEQNTLLVARIELHRQRLVRVVAIAAGVGAALLAWNVSLLLLR